MKVPTSAKAVSSAVVVVAGAVTALRGLGGYLEGEPAATWLPTVAFGILFMTFLTPLALDVYRPETPPRVTRAATSVVFGAWILVGAGLFVAGFRDLLVYLLMGVGVVGVLAIGVRALDGPDQS